MTSAYRPRNPGHDYHGRGTYLITLVVSGREQLLSFFSAMGIDALMRKLPIMPASASSGKGLFWKGVP